MATKVRDLLKLLDANGWYQVGQRDSHRQSKHPIRPGCVTAASKPGDTVPRAR